MKEHLHRIQHANVLIEGSYLNFWHDWWISAPHSLANVSGRNDRAGLGVALQGARFRGVAVPPGKHDSVRQDALGCESPVQSLRITVPKGHSVCSGVSIRRFGSWVVRGRRSTLVVVAPVSLPSFLIHCRIYPCFQEQFRLSKVLGRENDHSTHVIQMGRCADTAPCVRFPVSRSRERVWNRNRSSNQSSARDSFTAFEKRYGPG